MPKTPPSPPKKTPAPPRRPMRNPVTGRVTSDLLMRPRRTDRPSR
jgi:hypothetical protein